MPPCSPRPLHAFASPQHVQRNASKDHDAENLRRELERLQKRKETALERMLDGHVSGEEYADITWKVSAEIADTQDRLHRATDESLDVETAINYMGFVLWNVRHIYETQDLCGKQRLQAVSPSPRMGFGTSQPILFTYC